MRLKSSRVLDDVVFRLVQGERLPDGSPINGHRLRMSYFNLTPTEYGYVKYKIDEITHGVYNTLDDNIPEEGVPVEEED